MRSPLAVRSFRAILYSQNVKCDVIHRRSYGTVSGAPSYPSLLDADPASTPQRSIFQEAIEAKTPRTDWTRDEIKQIYDTPLMDLAFAAVSTTQHSACAVKFLQEVPLTIAPEPHRAPCTDASTTPQAFKCALF